MDINKYNSELYIVVGEDFEVFCWKDLDKNLFLRLFDVDIKGQILDMQDDMQTNSA